MEDLAGIILLGAIIAFGYLLFSNSSMRSEINNLQSNLQSERKRHNEQRDLTTKKIRELSEQNSEIKAKLVETTEAKQELVMLLNEKSERFPWLANAFADYQALVLERAAQSLERKKRPAPKAANEVRDAKIRAKDAEFRFRTIKYRQDQIENMFPWLSEITGDTLTEFLEGHLRPDQNIDSDESGDPVDPVSRFLAQEEFTRLSPSERNQLALDRWNKSKKSNWQIGREYERYVGYEYEKKGYRVSYFGAVQGLEDLGRDLVVKGQGRTLIVQCKYWALHKKIHEKHIFQLFGSVVEYIARENMSGSTPSMFDAFDRLADIRPVFVTSTNLSDKARDFAQILKVDVREGVPLGSYPQIKCNISKRDGGRVYHLPLDQQYDRTVIEPSEGEFYAKTVAEAEAAGFRRAFRWKPTFGD